ncbi:MAG: DUF3696 domain-containing protein [Candidatus Coatesbacteria bacterium]|nr:DUF3696 domain-containing protein [Candidatus Coatesbacteria bacterium]
MLTHLRIKNFKAWRDTGDIRLAPLTIFFGTNSSGKSSINQFLLMLKQTSTSPDRQTVLHVGDLDDPVDLGSFRHMVYGHDTTESISFEVGWELPELLDVKDVLSQKKFTGSRILFSAEIGQPAEQKRGLVVHKMSYELRNGPQPVLNLAYTREKADSYQLKARPLKLKHRKGRAWALPQPTHFYRFPDEVRAYYQNADFLSDLALEIENMLGEISYLGPVRQVPRRLYPWSGEVYEDVGWEGDHAVAAILAGRERRISRAKRKKSELFEAMIARWLKQMGLTDSFGVKEVAPDRRLYEVSVKSRGGILDVDLPDVGFGVSQVFPILVQCFYAQAGSVIILEEPEIHLHPSVQGSLADLFIEAVQAREDGKDRNIQLLVESHSEHFLRRLQRRIAEEEIAPNKVAVYFCRPTSSGAKMEPLHVDDYGNITNWPDDFFGNEFDDIARMTEKGIERRMKARSQ